MEKIPPFHPGDRVIRIGESDTTGVVHGDKYTIHSVHWCCDRIGWRVYLDELVMHYSWCCVSCPTRAPGWEATGFKKIDDVSDHTVESLLNELSPPIEELV